VRRFLSNYFDLLFDACCVTNLVSLYSVYIIVGNFKFFKFFELFGGYA